MKIIITLFILFFSVCTSVFSQITQRGTATGAASAGTSITINKPTGIAIGDLMIANIAQASSTGGTLALGIPPSGWTLIAGSTLGTNRKNGSALYKIAVAADVTAINYSFELSGATNSAVGAIIAFSGVNTTTPFDVANGAITVSTGTSVTANTKTTVTANTAIVMLGQASGSVPTWSGWSTTSPGTLTELYDYSHSGGQTSIGAAWAIKPSAGATGNGSATLSTSEVKGGILLALRPAGNSYCLPTYTNGPGTIDQITNVTLGALNNSIAGSTTYPYYTFYNAVTIPNLTQSTTASVSITFGSDADQYAAVWIDFNQDGIFDASEGVRSTVNAGSNGTTIINIPVPSGALIGNTRMRVRGGDDSALSNTQACGASSSSFGETEDYIVNIISPPPTITSLGTTNGCVGSSITINGTNFTGATAANVKIGGTPVTSITSNNGTTIVAVIGSGTTGTVSVTTSGGTATSVATFTVNTTPTITGTTPGSRPGTGTVNISATSSSGTTISWFTALTGGSLVGTSASGVLFATPSIATTTTYYAETANGGCVSNRTAVVATILCSTLVASFPYSEDFETSIGNWTQDTSDNFNWTRQTGGTPTVNTGPSSAASGSYYMYTEADGNLSNKTANFLSPCFDLTGTTNPRATFFYHMHGSTYSINVEGNRVYTDYMGDFSVDLSTDGGVTYPTNLFTQNGYVQVNELSSWIPLSFDLSAYKGQTVKFRIQGITNTDSRSDIAIDNFTITDKANPVYAPGGVTADLAIWLKANDGHNYSDGQSISLWEDQGKASDAKVHKTGQEPTYRDNAAKNINFNPVIEFDNPYSTYTEDLDYRQDKTTNSQFLTGDYGLFTQEMFIVLIPDDTPITSSFGFMDVYCGDSNLGKDEADATGIGFGYFTGRVTNEIICYAHGTYDSSDSNDGYAVAEIGTGSSYDNVGIINTRNNLLTSPDRQQLYYNAINIETTQHDLPEFLNTNDTRYWIGRSEGWESSLNARVVEVISYSARKTDGNLTQERNKIQSYLAIKYGITLGVNGTSQDYVDSAGNVIWDQSVNAGYNYDIAGIGRDDASLLNQKQSKSVNSDFDGTGQIRGLVTMALSNIYTTNSENISTNATTFNDREFLTWGNNDGNLDNAPNVVNVDMSDGIAGLSTLVSFTGMERVWKVEEHGGDIPMVKVSIPKSAVRNISPPGSFLMFISSTGVFDPTADYRVMTDDGTNLEVEYDFDGTKYITFGYAPETIEERSIYFDGAVDYVDMEDALDLNPTEFTVSAWINRGASSNNTSILSKRDATYTEGYDFKITNTGLLQMMWNGGTQSVISSTVIPENKWHHVAVTYSGGTATLYIDGVADGTASSLTNPIATTQSFFIAAAGKNTPTAHFEGNIDEVRVWNVALSVNQLRYVMNQEIEDNGSFVNGKVIPQTITKNEVSTIPWADLAGYYPMSVYTYTNTNDASGNGHQGALRNLNTVDWQTAPLPYISNSNGAWDTPATWLNNAVQELPNGKSILDGVTPIDWNIVQTTHDITSGNRDIKVLGLKNNAGKVTIAGTGSLDETNNGQGLTVTHYLEIDGVIDLIGESQLIQTEGSILDLDSGGYIERDQQGTANSFNYNYWSSSVGPISGNTVTRGTGIASVNSNNTVAGVLLDGTASATPQDINFNASYAAADSGPSSPRTISSFWLYTFNGTSDDYYSWNTINQSTPLIAGEGYTMKGTSGAIALATNQNYVFKGKPNNGDITLSILAGNDRLIGNPYPSAIDADEFIKDNIKETINSKVGRNTANVFNGALYFWHHFGEENSHILKEYVGGYATYTLIGGAEAISIDSRINNNLSTGLKVPERYIPVNQGFFVHAYLPSSISGTTATVDGGDIIFKNSQRFFQREVLNSGNGSVFFKVNSKSKANIPEKEIDTRSKIRLVFDSANGYHRQLLIGADKNTSNHFDMGYDAPIADVANEDMFWVVDDSKFVIQGVPNFNVDQQFPLGLIIKEQGLITIKIDKLENIDEDTPIYIKDNLTGETYNLSEKDFEINMEPGEYLNRFELTFQPRLKTLKEIYLVDGIFVNMNNDISELQINRIVDTAILNIKLFNFLGQQVESWGGNFNERKFSIPIKKSAGVYILHITTVDGVISKKIIIG